MKPDDDLIEMSPPDGHPTAGEIAALADGVPAGADRSRLEAHLAECSVCRDDLRIAVEATKRVAGTSRGWWLTGAAATAVAAAAAIVLLLVTPGMLDDSRDAVRRGAGDTASGTDPATSLEVVEPVVGESVSVDSPRFVWRSVGLDAQYRFHLATVAGDPIATVTTSDTVVTSLDDARLIPGTEYYWWVDAFRADRSTIETGPQRIAAVR